MEPRAHLRPGAAVAVAPNVRRIVAPNPSMMTGPGTNTYLLGTDNVAVIDPGPDDARHLEAILAAAGDRIRSIVVTHTHRDHSPLAARLVQLTGAECIGLPPPGDGRQDESCQPDRMPRDGERLPLGDVAVTAIHTPGHASNCVCYLVEKERLLVTGDHVLEGVSPVILAPDGDMSAYMASLAKLDAYDFDYIAPGHGGLMSQAKCVIARLYDHRRAREDKVMERLEAAQSSTIERLTPAVYDDVPQERHSWAQLTLEAHLLKLERDGRVERHGADWRTRRP